MINNVVLIGRLTRDPELRYTPSNVAVATFNLAVNRNFKGANGEREADLNRRKEQVEWEIKKLEEK